MGLSSPLIRLQILITKSVVKFAAMCNIIENGPLFHSMQDLRDNVIIMFDDRYSNFISCRLKKAKIKPCGDFQSRAENPTCNRRKQVPACSSERGAGMSRRLRGLEFQPCGENSHVIRSLVIDFIVGCFIRKFRQNLYR